MDSVIGLHTFSELFRQHYVSAVFILLTLVTILVILCLRWWFRRRWKQMLEQRFEEEQELDALPSIGPKDQEALELIRRFRQEIWDLPEVELQLNLDILSQRAIHITRAIAAIYHPEAEVPQYEASLVESIQLIRRVSTRLSRLTGSTPFSFFGNRKLSDYQRYYQVYRKINDNPLLQALKKNPHIYRAARLAMNVKNLANPLYWAGKELSREGYFYMLRWFFITFINQVGREAMRLYSGRHFQTEEDRDAALICYRLFAVTKQWGGPSADEWATLVDFTTGLSALETDTKVHILSRCSQNKLPKDLDDQELQTKSGVKWFKQGLKRILGSDPQDLSFKKQVVEQELSALED